MVQRPMTTMRSLRRTKVRLGRNLVQGGNYDDRIQVYDFQLSILDAP